MIRRAYDVLLLSAIESFSLGGSSVADSSSWSCQPPLVLVSLVEESGGLFIVMCWYQMLFSPP